MTTADGPGSDNAPQLARDDATTPVLRELRDADAARLAQLEQVLFPGDNPWTASDFRSEMSQPHSFYIGIDVTAHGETVLAGYAGLAMLGPREDPEFEIHTIGVDPAYQRRGFARLLMDNLMHVADLLGGPVFLEVRTDNVAAIALYEAYGFQRQGIRRRYYQPSGADAYTMLRPARPRS